MRIAANDNRRPAGTLHNGKLELRLAIANSQWFPEGESGSSIMMQAFGEEGRAPEIPGPMIRVPEGTEIHITLHNSLPDFEVVVHGLHTRPAMTDDVVKIPAGATREVTFQAGAPGTYFYWATSTKQPLQFRVGKDSQLSGAIIVDPKTGPETSDRTLIIGLYSDDPDSAAGRAPHPREIAVLNGKSWPYTERFTFTEGDTVSWRVINASPGPHPMHLHGFYFNVVRSGSEASDAVLAPSAISQANTKLVLSGTTMAIRFVPDRPGNWLFHCHLALHVDGKGTLQNILHRRSTEEEERDHVGMNHGEHEMAGLIIGIHVLPRGEQHFASSREPRRLRLLVQNSPRGYGRKPAIGFVLQQGAEPGKDSVTLPGPTLFLEKGRPARITVVNKLKVPTSVHWHGMEIDSYPDGVAGWSGAPGRLAAAIQPADSFIAEFTPPRAGTFIYHSHMNELVQTNSGMYGALIVTDSAHPFDPRIDKIILVGGGGPGNIELRSTGMVNGTVTPQFELEAGTTYRLRIIQIHPQANVTFQLGTDSTTSQWIPVAKDGADLPVEQSTRRAAFVLMGAGETGDFLFTPERPGLQKLSVQTRLAGWQIPVLLFVRPARKVVANTR
ncbi:MAG TPA: multicopper oxidase domain-containing protein [Gemmatimonadaceae bacterium]|nr:multicopper oxidase domain-containing protein [Gemmatimonadaceae bacterium]